MIKDNNKRIHSVKFLSRNERTKLGAIQDKLLLAEAIDVA